MTKGFILSFKTRKRFFFFFYCHPMVLGKHLMKMQGQSANLQSNKIGHVFWHVENPPTSPNKRAEEGFNKDYIVMSHLANIKITFSNLRPCTVNKILHVPLKQFALLGRLNYDTWNWRWKRKLKYCVLFCRKLDVNVWIFQAIWGGTNCGKVTNYASLWESFFFFSVYGNGLRESHGHLQPTLSITIYFRCVQCFVKGQTTKPISNICTAFISLSTLTVCVITLIEWENLPWRHLSWWLMRSEKASWDIWHILSSLKAWNNPNIHAHQLWLTEPLLQISL